MSDATRDPDENDDRLTRLTRGLAHDFNNLLAIIIGNIQLARDRSSDRQTKALLDEAEMAGQMAAAMITRLKTIATDQPLRLERLDVLEVLKSAIATFKAAAQPHDIVIQASSETLPIETDRNALLNAVLNLILNARDALPTPSSITIEVAAGEIGNVPGALAVAVTDAGSGMSAETAKRAFDPYFTTKGPADGRGLGLTSVLGFARQCGGDVKIESAPGAGTRVTMTLPALASHQASMRPRKQ